MFKSIATRLFSRSDLPLGISITILVSVVLLVSVTLFALITISTAPNYPDSGAIVEEQSFAEYVGLVNTVLRFLTTVIGILVAALLLIIILLGAQLLLWAKDRRKLADWQHSGLVVERLELMPGNRLRINSTEIELNRAQYHTLKTLINKRLAGEPLHPSELPGDNGTQMIKRLREELGARLVEQNLIKSRRGKGYWAEIDPDNVRIKEG